MDAYGNTAQLQLRQDNRPSRSNCYTVGYWVYTTWRCVLIRENLKWSDNIANWDGARVCQNWKFIDKGKTVEELMERNFELFL